MKKTIFGLLGAFLMFPAAFCIDVREFTVEAVKYTVESKIKCKVFNVSRMISVKTMVLYKDGKNHRFSFNDAPDVWINYLYNEDSGSGQFEWKSVTREAVPPGKAVLLRKEYQTYELLLPIERIIAPERLKEGAFSLGEDKYRDIACYKITIRYPANDQVIAKTSFYNFDPNYVFRLKERAPDAIGAEHRVTPDLFEQNRDEMGSEYFAAVQLWVDKTPGRPFIYAINAINRNGKIIYAMDWGEVEFLDRVDPIEFQVPGKTVITVNTHKEYAKQNRLNFYKLYGKNTPGWISRQVSATGTWFESNMGTILSWGGKITFCIAVITTLLVIILKIKAYRKR